MWSKVLKWCLYVIPLVAITFLLNAGPVLKRPMGTDDDVAGSLERVEQAALQEDWEQASSAWDQLRQAFVKVERRAEVVVEWNELQDFDMELARLRGAIQAEERSDVLALISVLKALFDEFGN
jgi:hypothetical protein